MRAGVPSADLAVVADQEVLIALDADAATNRNVYDAGVALREACLIQGAASVRFLRVPGGAKSGLDDVLGGQPADARERYLSGLIDVARARPRAEKPEAPAVRIPKAKRGASEDGAESPWFADGQLQVLTLSEAVQEAAPAALSREHRVAVYQDGVFKLDGLAFDHAVTELLGEAYRTGHLANVESFTAAQLYGAGYVLPDHVDEPVMNTAKCMVDLRTGATHPHAPSWRSTVQFPIVWDPNATCPTYERWLKAQAGDQMDDLEETVSMMLDPSLTPTKAVFLFGPARSGKGTMLRLISAVAGAENTSGVDLASLSTDRFAAANVYGKALNVSGDLAAMHVEDISMFKKLTGQDLIHGNRKHGAQFFFTNGALFVFGANDLPTVGESSRAYVERIKPFRFNASFAGAEDPTIEQEMMRELPGILVRWVKAYQRRVARGHALETAADVRAEFEVASDRVRQFVAARLEVGRGWATTTDLHRAFKEWSSDNGGHAMGKIKFAQRMHLVPGAELVTNSAKTRGWNVTLLPREKWDQHVGEESTPLDRVSVAELQSSPTTTTFEIAHVLDLEKDITDVKNVERSESGSSKANSATLQLSTSPIDLLFATLGDATPRHCPECGTPEVLVDMTWLACPHCYPETTAARVQLTHPTKES
jgi:putative DNA primase/helicase